MGRKSNHSDIGKRLEMFRLYNGIEKDDFFVMLEFGDVNAYNKMLRESVSKRVQNVLIKIYPELNFNWLMTGEGKMIQDTFPRNEDIHTVGKAIDPNTVNKYIKLLEDRVKELEQRIVNPSRIEEIAEMVRELYEDMKASKAVENELIERMNVLKDKMNSDNDEREAND